MAIEPVRYPVLWVEATLLFKQISGKGVVAGICSYSNRIWRVTKLRDMLTLLIIRDIIVSERCEEAEGCLDFDCSLNKTTIESLRRRWGIRRLPRGFAENFGKTISFNRDSQGNLHDFSDWVSTHPEGGIVVKRSKR